MAKALRCSPTESHPLIRRLPGYTEALPLSTSSHCTTPFALPPCAENWEEMLNVHYNPYFPCFSIYFFSRNTCFNNMINKTGEYTLFSMHMEHSLKETIFWAIKQVSTNFKGLKSYRAYSVAIVESSQKSTRKRQLKHSQIFENQAIHI